MCDECRMHPCHPRCPNAPEPRALFVCDECGLNITVEDNYMTMPKGRHFHIDCITDMNGEKVAELFGAEVTYGSERY